jgi:DNA-binding transcriptional MocR family regulator
LTDWHPHIDDRAGPRYIAIADALASDIAGGVLHPGDRLPTHRDLARRLGVNVGTVTRAYGEAERRGLTGGQVGRGTFVRPRPPVPIPRVDRAFRTESRIPGEIIDLTLNSPVSGPQAQYLAATLSELTASGDLAAALSYQPAAGSPAHRAAGAEWLSRLGLEATPDQVVVSAGGQNALIAALAALTLTEPGDTILCESLTFPGVKAAASLLRLKFQGVLMDEQGILPESLELACWSSGARVLYCMPTLQNPTASLMSVERRGAVLEIAERYDLSIIEDDVCGLLHPDAPPPLAALAPSRCFYLTSLSKALAPGLRVGYLLVPEAKAEQVASAVRATTWMAAPLMAEIAARWIGDGTADRLLEWQRRQAEERRELAIECLDGYPMVSQICGLHAWLRLPDPWRADEFSDEARAQGVAVATADVFAAGRSNAPQAVRLGLGAAGNPANLRAGLLVLATLLGTQREPRLPIV